MTVSTSGTATGQELVLYGRTDGGSDPGFVAFAHDLAPDTWIRLPRSSVARVTPLDGPSGSARVALTVATTDDLGAGLALIVTGLEAAITTLARRIGPAIARGSEGVASDSCTRCLEACSQIVVTKSDPFAQITCMLRCDACP